MDMALSGIKYCKSPVVDTKKQNNRPIFQPLRLLSSSASTMHQSKNLDFPFVPLTGHKLVDDSCIPTNFDIMNDHANFGDFLFDKGSNFTKHSSFKGCNQFPVFSISQLVGGFVGSKSQFRTENRESHQIWDIVFQKLDEFINSRTTERFSPHSYGFQTLSQNIFESFYDKNNPALDLAASYILADGCQSFKNSNKNIENIKSSPATVNSLEIIPTPVDTSAPLGSSFVPSHSSYYKSTVPVICEIVEQLVSQPDVTQQTLSEPQKVIDTNIDHLVPAAFEPTVCDNPSEGYEDVDQLQETSSLVSTEGKQSYAEVAKMAQVKSKSGRASDRPRPTMNGLIPSSSKQYKKVNNHNFSRNCRDPRQRGTYPSNWRGQGASSRQRGLKRDVNQVQLSNKSDVPYWKCEQSFKTVPTNMSQDHRRKSHEGLKHFKHFKGSNLKTVPEVAPPPATKQVASLACGAKSFVRSGCPTSFTEYSCQFNNLNKKTCMNWRCRQHIQKTSAKRNMKHVLNDSVIGDNIDDRNMSNSDLPPSPNDESAIRINTLENYITIRPHPSCGKNNGLSNLKQTHCDSKSKVKSLPIVSTNDKCMGISICMKGDSASDLTRPDEGSKYCVTLSPVVKERLTSESSDSVKSIPRSRSISEESRASSSSTNSANSCKLISEANLRRRFSSECDSEDSFVVFEGGVDFTDYDSDSLSDTSEEGSDLESEDECDSARPSPRVSMVICVPLPADDIEIVVQSPKMKEANEKWERNCASQDRRSSCKKVCFAASPCLATVHRMVKWDYAYRAARCGPWEEMARDRERFKQRVERSEPTIAPILEAAHRDKVATLLRSTGRHDVHPEPKLR